MNLVRNIKGYLVQLLAWTLLVTLNYHFYFFAESHQTVLFLVIKAVLTLLIIYSLFAALRNIISEKKRNQNLRLAWISILFTLILLESVFTFVARSHHAEISYASIIWQARHYKLNSKGFRDVEWDQKDTSRPALVFIGDSNTAGYGLDETSDRYSDKTGDSLKNRFEFYNLGVKATGLAFHYDQLDKVINQDKTLIYQVFINDLDDFCNRTVTFDIYSNFSRLDQYWSKSMFLLNYIYFSFPDDNLVKKYYEFFQSCNSNPSVHQKYFSRLLEFLEHAHFRSGYQRIIVVLIPALGDLTIGAEFEAGVTETVKKLNYVEVLQTRPLVDRLPLRRRVVNGQDTHPSKEVNSIIAMALMKMLNSQQLR